MVTVCDVEIKKEKKKVGVILNCVEWNEVFSYLILRSAYDT